METDVYLTVKNPSQGQYREKGSRFLAYAFPVESPDEIREHLESLRKEHHDARHHCYAWMLGYDRQNYRANDDGEPSGTAGRPILGQINSASLTNILIVVVRYFGGTLLGTSGLINAYRSAAADAIAAGVTEKRVIREHFEISFPYSAMNDTMKVLKDEDCGQANQQFGLECRMTVDCRRSSAARLIERLSRIGGMTVRKAAFR